MSFSLMLFTSSKVVAFSILSIALLKKPLNLSAGSLPLQLLNKKIVNRDNIAFLIGLGGIVDECCRLDFAKSTQLQSV